MDETKCNIADEKKLLRRYKFINSLYYIASILMPSIFLFELCNRNHAETNIKFLHIFITAGILAVGGLLLFVALKLITNSVEGALLLALLAWLFFWLYELLLEATRNLLQTFVLPSRWFALLLLVIFFLIIVILRRYKASFEKVRPAFNILAFCMIIFFVINLLPVINREMTFVQARNQRIDQEVGEEYFYIKHEFFIDPDLPNPDIHWLHMDGMMSIETVERFWGLCYDDFRVELAKRGFLIYGDVQLNAGSTKTAYAALLSPGFYDSFWGERLDNAAELIRTNRVAELEAEMTKVGITNDDDIAPYYELFSALVAINYKLDITTCTVWEGKPTSFYHLIGDDYSVTNHWCDFQRGGLAELLSMTTPLRFSSHSEGAGVVRGVWYQPNPVAQFVWHPINQTHMFYVLNHYSIPEAERGDYTKYEWYPSAFDRAIEEMIHTIDEILEGNPNAVIVLQSDHGFHMPATQNYLLEQGYSHEQVTELSHSVFSAVRIPREYGGLEEPIAPLNITREIVNRFVGKNYELLVSE